MMPKDERHLHCFALECWFLMVDKLMIVKGIDILEI
jgi:hypothetical protein